MWGLNYAPHVERYKMLAALFKEKTGADVKVQPQNNPQQAILAAVAGNKTPDVICLMAKLSGQLVKQKALLPVDDVVFADTKIDMDKWWMPDAIGSYVFGDQHLGVPVEGSGTGLLGDRPDRPDRVGRQRCRLALAGQRRRSPSGRRRA